MSSAPESDYYNRLDLWEEDYFNPVHEARAERIALLVPSSATSVLDVGSGAGIVGRALERRGKLLVSADIAIVPLARAPGARIVADSRLLPLVDGSVDAVVAAEILEHLTEPDRHAAVREIQRVTRQAIVATVPYRERFESSLVRCPSCGEIFHPNYHARSFVKHDVASLFEPEFVLDRLEVVGPRRPFVPAPMARLAHRVGIYRYAPKSTCPRCGFERNYESTRAVRGDRVMHAARRVAKALAPRLKGTWYAARFVRR